MNTKSADSILAASKTPGIQYVAVDANAVLYEYDGGWADLARRRPMDAATTMMAYSMSKTITAAAVLQLVEAGKVGLDDGIDRYLDAQPYGQAITVRQLIAHTSGIPNPIPLRWVHAADRHAAFDEGAALARVLARHNRSRSRPGAKYAYSNIGYWLLGRIVERASGQAFTAYVGEHVLRPLSIAPHELGYAMVDPGRHATGYLEKWSLFNLMKGLLIDRALIGASYGSWIEIRPHYPNGQAFGGLVGTARGFGKFLRDQLRPRSVLFDPATRGLFYETQRTRRGRPIAMTLGWHIGVANGVRFYYKEGGGGGFHGMMRLYPERGIGTVVIGNATGFAAAGCLDAVDREVVA